jgi:hypothetical protein
MADEKIPVKEGVLLDRDGTPVFQEPADHDPFRHGGAQARIRIFRPSWPMALGFAILLPALLLLGFAVAAVVVAVVLLFSLIGSIMRIFSPRR